MVQILVRIQILKKLNYMPNNVFSAFQTVITIHQNTIHHISYQSYVAGKKSYLWASESHLHLDLLFPNFSLQMILNNLSSAPVFKSKMIIFLHATYLLNVLHIPGFNMLHIAIMLLSLIFNFIFNFFNFIMRLKPAHPNLPWYPSSIENWSSERTYLEFERAWPTSLIIRI